MEEKKIFGKYKVVDCEHDGDIVSAKNECLAMGCEVIDVYWDGIDCGVAYIEIKVDKNFVRRHINDNDFQFDVRYSDYKDVGGFTLFGIAESRPSEIDDTIERLWNDISEGFEMRMPYLISLSVTDKAKAEGYLLSILNKYGLNEHDIVHYFGGKDGKKYYFNVLVFGDYALGGFELGGFDADTYWGSKNRYSIQCRHITAEKRTKEEFWDFVKAIKAHKPIKVLKEWHDCYREIDFNEYCVDGKLVEFCSMEIID